MPAPHYPITFHCDTPCCTVPTFPQGVSIARGFHCFNCGARLARAILNNPNSNGHDLQQAHEVMTILRLAGKE